MVTMVLYLRYIQQYASRQLCAPVGTPLALEKLTGCMRMQLRTGEEPRGKMHLVCAALGVGSLGTARLCGTARFPCASQVHGGVNSGAVVHGNWLVVWLTEV